MLAHAVTASADFLARLFYFLSSSSAAAEAAAATLEKTRNCVPSIKLCRYWLVNSDGEDVEENAEEEKKKKALANWAN